MNETEKFIKLYNEVFDTNGNVTACGRDKCKELINISNKIEPSKIHGDLRDGFMDIDSIKNLKSTLA